MSSTRKSTSRREVTGASICHLLSSVAVQLRRFWLRLALGLLLVFAQQQATLHALQHGVDSVAGKQAPGSPQPDTCVQCLLFGGLHDAPPATAIRVAVAAAGPVQVSLPAQTGAPTSPIAHYRSRAPPYLS